MQVTAFGGASWYNSGLDAKALFKGFLEAF
jgi:hypothetical protein